MTTWIGHLRIAERLLKTYAFDEEAFMTGSIAPDSGIPKDEKGLIFDPPKEITHWWKNETERIPDPQRFFDTYLQDSTSLMEPRRSFLIAYYLHLIADVMWTEQVVKPMRELPEYEGWRNKDLEMIRDVKRDWYGHDFLYLRDNPESLFFTHYRHIKSIPDYLDYFPPSAFTVQMSNIQEFYLNTDIAFLENREFVHLPLDRMNAYIESTIQASEAEIKKHDW